MKGDTIPVDAWTWDPDTGGVLVGVGFADSPWSWFISGMLLAIGRSGSRDGWVTFPTDALDMGPCIC